MRHIAVLALASALLVFAGAQTGADPVVTPAPATEPLPAAQPEAPAGGPAAQFARAIRNAGLDIQACYRVRDLAFSREDIRFYLTDGYLILGKPVEGRIFSAVFVATPETGDAEVIVSPPDRSERASLARYIESPTLNEHLITAVFLFSDNAGRELAEQLRASSAALEPEKGVLIAGNLDRVVRNLTGSLEMRMVHDHLTGLGDDRGLFYAALTGAKLGNFDVVFDAQAHQQVTVGRLAERDNRTYFDVWTNFAARSWRTGRRANHSSGVRAADFRITAELQPDLQMKATTRLKLTPSADMRGVVPFELSRRMRITKAVLDGRAVEVFGRESLRADALRGDENGIVLIVAAEPLEAGRTYEVEFEHEGTVVTAAGNGVYFVGARTTWYPNHATNFSSYDLTFRYPRALHLVATGDVVEDVTEGEFRVTRRRTPAPIRFAGFNLGEYTRATAARAGYTVEVFANRKVETALRPRIAEIVVLPAAPAFGRGQRRPAEVVSVPLAPPNPAARVQEIADDVATALEVMTKLFGPAPLRTLTVSPIPGTFGQGFPGLVYLSTLSYLDPKDRPPAAREEATRLFYSELLHAHEVAHQWWGNTVTSASGQDEWLMEALANYSALLVLEQRKGRRALDSVLAEYRNHLLTRAGEDRTIESAGPIVWGARLVSSQTPSAWRVITYEKGSWIMHMLRAQLGDERFSRLLSEMVSRYRYRSVSTEQFRALAVEFLPQKFADPGLQLFFDQWVYATGIPELKLSHSVRGKTPAVKVRGTIRQTGVAEDFSALVPVEIQLPGRRSVVQWIRTSSDPVSFSADVRATPLKVSLDPGGLVLRR